ncbi:MAG: hypothetical protein HOJ35_06695 [Bdellovibrionales bacterium]|jgi:hypothetical protein|nr:hypothetical protein [Bdellovibrionales bacterium]
MFKKLFLISFLVVIVIAGKNAKQTKISPKKEVINKPQETNVNQYITKLFPKSQIALLKQ